MVDLIEAVMSGDQEPTVCAECGNLFVANPKDGYWLWMCMASPRPKWFNPVNGVTAADPPYERCKNLNNGNCPSFKPGANSITPDKLNRGTYTGAHLPKGEEQ